MQVRRQHWQRSLQLNRNWLVQLHLTSKPMRIGRTWCS